MRYLLRNGGICMAGDFIITGGRPLSGTVRIPAAWAPRQAAMLSSNMTQSSGATFASSAAFRQRAGSFFSTPSSWAKVIRSKKGSSCRWERAVRQCSGTLEVTTAMRMPRSWH